MKVTLSAVVPVVQYGNLQPTVEVEADTYEEAMAQAEAHITAFWNKHVEGTKQIKGAQGKKLKAFVGGEINYDDNAHVYTNDAGEVYLSGSQYATKDDKPFDTAMITGKMAEKSGVDATDIATMWALSAEASMKFGTAIHAALELYGKYGKLAATLEKEYHIHSQPDIKRTVQSFYAGRESEKAVYEALVVDHTRKWAGQIDRLKFVDTNTVIVQDFKTNSDMPQKKLDTYWKQLNFYAAILVAGGYKVQGLEILHWTGSVWKVYESGVKVL
jgi:hypothetical protein